MKDMNPRTVPLRARFPALLALLFAFSPPAEAATILVPADQPTIQAAIVAAGPGDLVLVAPGTYAEEIDFLGKAITVRSTLGPEVTILDPSTVRSDARLPTRRFERRIGEDHSVEIFEVDGHFAGELFYDQHGTLRKRRQRGTGNQGSVVLFSSGETRASVLEGFTIRGGLSSQEGGGVRIDGSSPTLRGNIITGNRSCIEGGGVAIAFSSPLVEDNIISNNQQRKDCFGGSGGGGIAVRGAGSAEIRGNTISGNSHSYGGAIWLFAAGTPQVVGNTLDNNSASGGGGGFDIVNLSQVRMIQNVIRRNTGGPGTVGDGIDWTSPTGEIPPIVLNNTFVHNGEIEILLWGTNGSAIFANNLVLANSAGTAIHCSSLGNPTPVHFVNNNVFAPGGTAYGGICSSPVGMGGNISADPLLANAAGGNFHLLPGSPSIDAGNNSLDALPDFDFDGFARIVDGDGNSIATVDQGVFENQAGLVIFSDGFESGDASGWSLTAP